MLKYSVNSKGIGISYQRSFSHQNHRVESTRLNVITDYPHWLSDNSSLEVPDVDNEVVWSCMVYPKPYHPYTQIYMYIIKKIRLDFSRCLMLHTRTARSCFLVRPDHVFSYGPVSFSFTAQSCSLVWPNHVLRYGSILFLS